MKDELNKILENLAGIGKDCKPRKNITQARTAILSLIEKEIKVAKAHQEMETYCSMKKWAKSIVPEEKKKDHLTRKRDRDVKVWNMCLKETLRRIR